LENKKVEVGSWLDKKAAIGIYKQSISNYNEKNNI